MPTAPSPAFATASASLAYSSGPGRRLGSTYAARSERPARSAAGSRSGCSSPAMSSSLMPSRCLTSARSELPCAATERGAARLRGPGRCASYQYGSIRSSTSFRHSVRRDDVGSEIGVALVDPARLAVLDRRRRGVVRAAPEHELLVAVLLFGRSLVEPLQRPVVPLVQPPGAPHRNPLPPALLERQRRRVDRPGQQAGVQQRRAARPFRASAHRRGAPPRALARTGRRRPSR